MVTIPVRLYAAARRVPVQFHDGFDPTAAGNGAGSADGSNLRQFPAPRPCEEAPAYGAVERVRRAYVGAESGVLVDRADLLKLYEDDGGRTIVFTPDEVKALRPQLSRNLEIKRFVSLEEIDRTFFDVSYYLWPEKGAEKPYAIFHGALKLEGRVAIGELATHQNEQVVAIRPGDHGLVVHTLFYENEVCLDREYRTDLSLASEKELELARMFVKAQSEPFDPAELKNKFEQRVLEVADKKSQAAASSESGEPPRTRRVVDFEELLRKSLERLPKKPAGSERGHRGARKKNDERRRK
ncbi:MAG: hypothetical protein M1541_07510 [Acidobacteria bacterium]|nr:hypothetical protein [Acidobacteriota bacterium]